MRVVVFGDMEGVAGICRWEQVERRQARLRGGAQLYTEELNAAVRGAFAAGADEVVVMDCHGAGGDCSFNSLLPEALDPAASSWSRREWTEYTERARAGLRRRAVRRPARDGGRRARRALAHRARHELARRCASTARPSARSASTRRCAAPGACPVALVTGDDVVCDESTALLGPSLQTLAVKQGLGRFSARHLPPRRARAMIRAGRHATRSRRRRRTGLRPRRALHDRGRPRCARQRRAVRHRAERDDQRRPQADVGGTHVARGLAAVLRVNGPALRRSPTPACRGPIRSPVVPAPRSSRGTQRCATSIAVDGVERRSRAAAARSASIAAPVPTDGTADAGRAARSSHVGRVRQRAQHDARSLHEIGYQRVPLARGDQREQRGRRLHLPAPVVADPRRCGERLGVELGQPRRANGRRGARPSAALCAGRSPPAPGRLRHSRRPRRRRPRGSLAARPWRRSPRAAARRRAGGGAARARRAAPRQRSPRGMRRSAGASPAAPRGRSARSARGARRTRSRPRAREGDAPPR